jgi:hypothetical protein
MSLTSTLITYHVLKDGLLITYVPKEQSPLTPVPIVILKFGIVRCTALGTVLIANMYE